MESNKISNKILFTYGSIGHGVGEFLRWFTTSFGFLNLLIVGLSGFAGILVVKSLAKGTLSTVEQISMGLLVGMMYIHTKRVTRRCAEFDASHNGMFLVNNTLNLTARALDTFCIMIALVLYSGITKGIFELAIFSLIVYMLGFLRMLLFVWEMDIVDTVDLRYTANYCHYSSGLAHSFSSAPSIMQSCYMDGHKFSYAPKDSTEEEQEENKQAEDTDTSLWDS